MNPKLKIKAEIEAKLLAKYEQKAKELEAEFRRQLEIERADNRRKLMMGMQLADDAALMAADDVFDVNEYSAERFHERHIFYVNKMSHMAVVEDKDDPNMEWTKDTIDRRLRQIVGKDNFVPWDERMEVR
jgi:hypothetical protein